MISIINYEAGNLASVSNALERLNVEYVITSEIEELNSSNAVIFPGVGHAKPAMQALKKRKLDIWLKETRKPVLGICLGMQLLFEKSNEGDTEGLGVIPGILDRFDNSKGKVPHMGWNSFSKLSTHPLVKNISSEYYFYYVHSYYAPVNKYCIARCKYLTEFASIVGKDNYIGVQFHPEKSGREGHLLLQNFVSMIEKERLNLRK